MSHLIISAHEKNLTNLIYYGTMIAGLLGELITALILSKRYKEKAWKVFMTWLIGVPLLYLWMKVQFWIESGFQNFSGYNIVRTYVWFPPTAWLLSVALDADPKKMCDIYGPSCVVIQAVAHWGCAFMGCCYGIRDQSGIYNVVLKDYRFPVQLLEALVSIVIVIILLLRAKRKMYAADGTQFPWMLILFGTTRFALEFLRDNQKLFWGISTLAIHCIVMVLVGIIWLKKSKAKPEEKKLFISTAR